MATLVSLWLALFSAAVYLAVQAMQDDPPPPPPREWHDVALLVLLVVFYLMKGTLIERRTALGWAFSLSNITLAMLFLWGVVAPLYPPLMEHVWVGTILRIALVIFVVGSIVELLAVRLSWPSPGETIAQVVRDRYAEIRSRA